MTATVERNTLCTLALRYMNGDTGADTEYRDVIDLAGDKKGAVVWFPHANPTGHSLGFVRIETPDDATTYSLSGAVKEAGEFRVFLTKASGKGTDVRRRGYAVLCRDGKAVGCECYGSVRSVCKHRKCVDSLIGNRWI